MATATVSKNVADITLPAGATISVKAKTNSKLIQHISLTGAVAKEFSGSGEHNANIGSAEFQTNASTKVQATFHFTDGDAKKLNKGGPYDIGAYNLLVIVAENGDDSDYNDAIVEFSWYTKK